MRVFRFLTNHHRWNLVILFSVLILSGLTAGGAIQRNLISLATLEPWALAVDRGSHPTCQPSALPALAPARHSTLALGQDSAGLGRRLWISGRCDDALDAWRRCVARNPNDAMCALGLLYGGQLFDIPGQLREPLANHASERARQALQSGDVASAQSWDRDARSLWTMLAAAAPVDEPQKWWADGQIAEADGLWREAALAYGRGAAVAPDPYDFWMRQGYAYEQVPDSHQASASYQRASQARPSNGAPYLALGTLERNSQHYDEAISWYAQAAALMPHYDEPLGQIGYTYFISGRYAEARPYFESILARSPNEAWSAYYLSQVLKAENDTVMALTWLERAVASSSQQPWDWAELLGDWRLAQGDVSGALEAYQTALSWNPGDSTELKLKVGELQSGHN